jgi:D-alanyl-lipoteichoic acid acyltransferase DltB (MBOAT superfamily)
MLFPTIQFGIFFPIVFLVSWLLRPYPTRWKLFMILASYVFYGWWDWRFCFLLAASTIANQIFVAGICATRGVVKRAVLTLAIVSNLGVLAYFKYYDFFRTSIVDGLDKLGVHVTTPLLEIVLPVGISFFTFQAMSYVIDAYRDNLKPVGLLDFAVYLSFFPHLVAGPIVRATEFLPQLRRPADPRRIEAARAFRLIVAGLFKKVVVSSFLASTIVDKVFAAPDNHSSLEILFAIYGYAFQIYFDFSGYSDMAVGLALMMGFVLIQNFDSPYKAVNIIEFWRRWHMTLSRFLRDYLYIPLGGNRQGPARRQVNLLLTMLLGGLWHGAAWTFVVWGGLHGAYLQINHAWRHAVAGAPRLRAGLARFPRLVALCAWGLTFVAVVVAWVVFRAESFTGFAHMLQGMFLGSQTLDADLLDAHTAFYMGAGLLIAFFARNSQALLSGIGERLMAPGRALDRSFLQGAHVGALLFLIVSLVLISASWGTNEFIYFNF